MEPAIIKNNGEAVGICVYDARQVWDLWHIVGSGEMNINVIINADKSISFYFPEQSSDFIQRAFNFLHDENSDAPEIKFNAFFPPG